MQDKILASGSASSSGGLRPMSSADFPAIEEMFFKIFRPKRKAVDPAFVEYFERLFFTGPASEFGGGLVSQDGDSVGSAIALMPITYIAYDRELTARLACAFMSTAPQSKAAARIVLSLRARGQDMLFTDSAATSAVGHWTGGGSVVVPVNSLDWQCTFRPAAAVARKIGVPKAMDLLWAPADRVLSRRRKHGVSATADHEISLSAYAARAPEMISHFSVRPKWVRF